MSDNSISLTETAVFWCLCLLKEKVKYNWDFIQKNKRNIFKANWEIVTY